MGSYPVHFARIRVANADVLRFRIKTVVTQILRHSVSEYKRLMDDWMYENWPRDTSNMFQAGKNIVDRSQATVGDPWTASFFIASPAPYSTHVNAMGPRTNWGSSPDSLDPNPNALTHFWWKTLDFLNGGAYGAPIVKNIIMRLIVQSGIHQRLKMTPDQFYDTFLGLSNPIFHE